MESINPRGTKHHHNRGLAEGSWKGMKKYLEQDMLCLSLRGRVSYHLELYPRFSAGFGCFCVALDGETVKKFGYFPSSAKFGWDWGFPCAFPIPMENRDEYTDWEFSDALKAYRHQPIAESLNSQNPMVRLFAIVDRRVGKRTLQRLADTVEDQPEWLRCFYQARLVAEGITAKRKEICVSTCSH